MGKKKLSKVKMVAGIVGGAIVAGGVLWVTFSNGVKLPVPAHKVAEVLDGDTFYTSDGLRMRLADVNAPEIGRCGSSEARQRLKELIANKTIYVKTKSVDPFHRDDVLVYTDKGLVNLIMLEEGMGVYYPKRQGVPESKKASEEARKLGIGIFGPKCTQSINYAKPSCNIKGNLTDVNGQKIKYYYLDSCGYYSEILVEKYKGEDWFCTERDARNAGFNKSKYC